jgi:hypothetical protein
MSHNRRNQQEGSFLKTAAIFGVGAAAGALLAWFATDTEDNVNPPHQQNRTTGPNNAPSAAANASATDTDFEDEKKDGVLQCCEICFLPFDEIKAHDGQIMATPCGHVFCRCCILESLRAKPECPHCRQDMNASELQRLYI